MKLDNNVYSIGSLDFIKNNTHLENYFLFNLINLFQKGKKFIPCYYGNSYYFLSSLLNFMEEFLIYFNSKMFFINIYKKTINDENPYLKYLHSNHKICFFKNKSMKNKSDFFTSKITDEIIDNTLENIKNSYHKCYPIQYETLKFEFEFFKIYSNIKFDYKLNNITPEQYKTIKHFIKFKPFKITECDKNIGVSILSNELYDELCLEHLNNNLYFKFIENSPLLDSIYDINDILLDLKINKNISSKLYKKSQILSAKAGNFRILTKLHKSNFSTRPIVNCRNHLTSKISFFIFKILQPFIIQTKSYTQDSQHLLRDFENLIVNKDLDLYTLDIDNLYMNMVLDDVLTKITDFMSNKLNTKHLNIIGFHHLLKIVLFNNYITFKGKYYLQIKGIAMGCICAPAIANLYLSILEEKFLNIYNPFLYRRYLDDIFLSVDKDFNINLLFPFFLNLKLTYSSSNELNFLDLNISIDYFSKKFSTKLFIKPTQSFNFLLTNSNHPRFIFKNIPFSIFIRIRRNCTNLYDYFYFSNLYFIEFLKCGYDYNSLIKSSIIVTKIDRSSLLQYKKKTNFLTDNKFISCFKFDLNLEKLYLKLGNSFDFFKKYYIYLQNYKLKIINSMQPNLSLLLIHNIFSFNFNLKKLSYKKCLDLNCSICKFAACSNLIKYNRFIKIPITCNSSCESSHVIYIIRCKKCNYFYIGQTSRSIKERIKEHLYAINKFIPYFKNFHATSIHFNLKGHTINDFSFFVYSKNLTEDTKRCHIESKLIEIFQNILNLKLMNINIPNCFNNIGNILI